MHELRVLAIVASPRAGGNTDILVDRALEGARGKGAHVEKLTLSALKFAPCQSCVNMPDDGVCVVHDQMQAVYEAFGRADVIVIGSPIYFGSLSAQAKLMIDRFQCHWRARNVLKKPVFPDGKRGIFISVQASSRQDFFDNARAIIRHFFSALGIKYEGELFCMALEGKGEALKRPECLKEAFLLGVRSVEGLL